MHFYSFLAFALIRFQLDLSSCASLASPLFAHLLAQIERTFEHYTTLGSACLTCHTRWTFVIALAIPASSHFSPPYEKSYWKMEIDVSSETRAKQTRANYALQLWITNAVLMKIVALFVYLLVPSPSLSLSLSVWVFHATWACIA